MFAYNTTAICSIATLRHIEEDSQGFAVQICKSDHPRHICCVSPKWSHSGIYIPLWYVMNNNRNSLCVSHFSYQQLSKDNYCVVYGDNLNCLYLGKNYWSINYEKSPKWNVWTMEPHAMFTKKNQHALFFYCLLMSLENLRKIEETDHQ